MELADTRLLLVDDDEDQFVIVRDMLSDLAVRTFALDWVATFEEGLAEIVRGRHAAYLIDYRLGAHTGMELLHAAVAAGGNQPIILLTGQGDREIDEAAMKAGAADYLIKGQFDADLLERSIRYALKRAETLQEMRESEQRYRALVESQEEAVCRWRPDTTLTFVNEGYCRCAGKDRAELLGRSWLGFAPEASRAEMTRMCQDLVAQPRKMRREQEVTGAAGEPRWQEWIDSPIIDDQGRLLEFQSVARDVTERKGAEAERVRLATAVEQTAEAIIITDTQGHIVYINPAFEAVSGYPRRETLGQTPRLLKSGKQEEDTYRKLWTELTQGRVWSGRLTNRRKDGTEYEVEATITPVRDPTGRIINFIATERDISYERAIEQQLRQAQKMEAMGQLAGGVAHDFNNLLTVIIGFASILERATERAAPLDAHVNEIQKAAERAADLTRQLLAFSRKQIMRPRVLDLSALVHGLEDMLRRLIGENIELRTVLSPNLSQAKADPSQIEQVIMNLVINARDAMPRGGKLTIETTTVTIDQPLVLRSGRLLPGRYALIAVTDTGRGMSEEVQAHIFEPFFTTKEPGKGTGLGLATCFGIIKQSRGDIHVYSEPGRGTTFKIYLPQTDEAPAPQVERGQMALLPRGTETVLVVEDEPGVRDLAANVLVEAGYTVFTAGNGVEGLDVVRGLRSPEPALVVTDVVMPDMGGIEMAEQLKTLSPAAKVLYMSGYTRDALTHHGELDGGIYFLEKPFSPTHLISKVREVLDHGQGGGGTRRKGR